MIDFKTDGSYNVALPLEVSLCGRAPIRLGGCCARVPIYTPGISEAFANLTSGWPLGVFIQPHQL